MGSVSQYSFSNVWCATRIDTMEIFVTSVFFLLGSLASAMPLVGSTHGIPVVTRTVHWPQCDPLCPLHCSLPMPSNFFAVSVADGPAAVGASSPTNLRVNFTSDMLPRDGGNRTIDPLQLRFYARDGFSVGGPIVFMLQESPLPDQSVTPTWANISLSLNLSTSPTLLIDLDRGVLVPHWFEIDIRSAPLEGWAPPLLLYPAEMLNRSTRHVIVVRGMVNAFGQRIAPSPAFAALRDNTSFPGDASIADRRPMYAAMFDYLSQPPWNIDRKDVQLMWDVTTESMPSQLKRFLHMREDALSRRIPTTGPRLFVTDVQLLPNIFTAAFVSGQLEVPLYLTSNKPGGLLVLNETDGLPTFQGYSNASFLISIPLVLAPLGNGPPATRTGRDGSKIGWIQTGNGLFGTYRAAADESIGDVANSDAHPFLVGSVAYWGLEKTDELEVAAILATDISLFATVPDRLTQSLVNHLTLTKAFTSGAIVDAIALLRDYNISRSDLDAANVVYTGASLGGIMGGVVATMSPDIKRAVLQVDGSPFGLLLPRAYPFKPLWDVIALRGYDVVDRLVLISLLSFALDVATPPAFLPHGTSNPLPGCTCKQFVTQHGLSDASVTYLGGQVSARSLNAGRFLSSVSEPGELVYSLPEKYAGRVWFGEGECGHAVFQAFDFSNPPIPFGDIPVEHKYSTHSCLGKEPRAMATLAHFFRTRGEVYDYCESQGCHRLWNSTCG